MSAFEISRLLSMSGFVSQALAAQASRLFHQPQNVREGQLIGLAGVASDTCHLILDGIAFRHLDTETTRQITCFLLPGDWSDLSGLFYPKVGYSVSALTPCRLAAINHQALSQLMEEHISLSRDLWSATLKEAAIEREWLLNIGQRNDEERIAHLLSELVWQLAKSGMCDGRRCRLPLSDLEVAQCTGCSRETVARVLDRFMGLDVLELAPRSITVLNVERLNELGAFASDYLESTMNLDVT